MIDENRVHSLKTYMDLIARKKEILKAEQEAFNEENNGIIDDIKFLSSQAEDLKAILQEQALEEFKETGNKKLLGGIGIREKNTISYDGREALVFAKKKDLFLTLDKKAFDKAAPSLGLDFVTVERIPQVTFPAVIKEVE